MSSEASENKGTAFMLAISSKDFTELTNCSVVMAGLTAPVL